MGFMPLLKSPLEARLTFCGFQEVVRKSPHPPFAKKQYPLFPVEIKQFFQGWLVVYYKEGR